MAVMCRAQKAQQGSDRLAVKQPKSVRRHGVEDANKDGWLNVSVP